MAKREPKHYNLIAGGSLERIAALSDGIFGVAMTLLVLDLKAPAENAVHSEADLWRALVSLGPQLLMYFTSFMTAGIFWVGQQTQLNYFTRGDRNLAWIHIGFLATVVLLPFSTSLLAEHTELRLALLVYWFNMLLLGAFLYGSLTYADRAGLIRSDAPEHIAAIMCRRILVYQALYAVGALLCVVSPYLSIGAILFVQLNSVLAPRVGPLARV